MLKHIGHLHQGKLHTFDDFYRDENKTTKSRSTSSSTNDLTSTNNSSPSSPSSPNSNPYTFYSIFSDFKSTVTPDVVPEEDESEQDTEIIPQQSTPPTAVFYFEDDQHQQQHNTPPYQPSSSSPHWPSLILNRFRHATHHHGFIKQNSVNDSQMTSTKLRKTDSTDSVISKHRFLKRSQTILNTNGFSDKRSSNEDFPELSLPTNNTIEKKHRSFVSLLHHFHPHNNNNHHHHQQQQQNLSSNSTGTLHVEKVNSTNHTDVPSRPKLIKQKTLSSNNDHHSPVKKSSPTPMLPKIASLFHRHHLSEHHKYRVGNLKARLHHRRNSPPLTNTAPKFQCQASNELIEEIKQLEEQEYTNEDYLRLQRPVKPVVMKRVHTWHNSFNLRPVDQCLEY